MKVFPLCLLMFLLPFLLSGQDTSPNSTKFQTVDNILLNSKDYVVQVKYTQTDFTLNICNISNCYETRPFARTLPSQNLYRAVVNRIKTIDITLQDSDISDDEKVYLTGMKERIIAFIEKDERSKKTERDQVLSQIDNAKDQYSGELSLHGEVKNFKVVPPSKAAIRVYYYNSYTENEVDGKKEYTLTDKSACDHKNDKLTLEDATLIFFNNRASTVAINATLTCDDGSEKDLEFYNYKYSIPVRAFTYYRNASSLIMSKYVLTADLEDGNSIEIHANDIFDYKSFGNGTVGNFGFSIANQRLHVSNDKKKYPNSNPVKVVQRRFFDFFTGVVYSDLMGLNTNASNSLINAQASLLMPMNLGNWSELTALRQFRVNVNVALNNSFENEARYIGFADDDKVNHFDLYRKTNLGGTLSLDLLSYESKGWFLTWSLGYNAGFYRTGYQYTNTVENAADEVSTGQLLSITHGPYLNFEFRPQDNFGADIMISLDELNLNDDDTIEGLSLDDGILVNDNSNSYLAKHNMVNVSANFYWLLSPGKSDGGVYARLGLAYHTPTEASFPQLMVGYATNLTSFVNRFKVKDKDNKQTIEK
ncbi:hypothetical protein [Winogradskyella sp.]|uniref:hypothetical protein n=1 Tax=Winogradskyella sp. TaxID=1883156 RepID=UPI0035182108